MDADPLAQRDDTRGALSDPAYVAAFERAMVGDVLDADQVAAVNRARTLTGTTAPAYPMPLAPDRAGPFPDLTPGTPVQPLAGTEVRLEASDGDGTEGP